MGLLIKHLPRYFQKPKICETIWSVVNTFFELTASKCKSLLSVGVKRAVFPLMRTSLCSESTHNGPTLMMDEGRWVRVERPLRLTARIRARSCDGKNGLRK